MVMLGPYDDEAIAACRSVLVETFTILGKHRKYLVLVGGWVPPLLFGEESHIGSLDVDLAVDWRHLPDYVYGTLRNELASASYRCVTDARNGPGRTEARKVAPPRRRATTSM